MKKIFFFTAISFLVLNSCKKEATKFLDEQSSEIINSSTNNSVQAVPISSKETSALQGERWNPCSQEFVDFSGTIYTEVRGVITSNKITFVLHINVSNVRAVGRTSGTEYVTTGTFNYSNTFNFNTQFVYQQRSSTNFIALGKDSNFSIENDWHLTVNANGDVSFFFTTGGEVIKCQ